MHKGLEALLSGLVALVFTAAAGFVVWFLGHTFTSHYKARNWTAVPATVQTYDVRTSRTRSGTSMMTTLQERIVATYTYTFEGRSYTNDRVDFSFGSDNFSGSKRTVQLAALRSGSITIFVDPKNPQESVFDRSLPGGQVVFAIVFLLFPCGVGTAFTIGMLSAGLSKFGLTSLERFYLPVLGILHSAPALYPVLFDPGSIGFGGWLILTAFLVLLAVSVRSFWRRIADPTIGAPRWPKRFGATEK
jgi:hypothetical protein